MKVSTLRLKLLAASPVFVLALALTPATALAEHGSGDSTASTTTTSGSTDDPSSASTTDDSTSPTTGTDSLHDRAEKLLAAKRQDGKVHSAEQRKTVCEARQHGIDTKLSSLSTNAQRHLDRLNGVFTKTQAFQTTNQLDVPNYDALVAAATAKQTAATTAVDALKGASSTIDCTAADPAASLAAVKTAASDARTALQSYRSALKDLVQALRTAKSTTSDNNTSTDGGTQ